MLCATQLPFLSSFLALDCGQQVISVEGSEQHMYGQAKRIRNMIAKKFPDEHREIIQKNISKNSKLNNLRLATLFIDSDVDPDKMMQMSTNLVEFLDQYQNVNRKDQTDMHVLHSQIQGKMAPRISDLSKTVDASNSDIRQEKTSKNDQEMRYTALGLHACGDLSVTCLKMIFNPKIKYVFSVPCCYQHLSDQSFPLNSETQTAVSNLFDDFYPSSPNFTSMKLPRQLLNYACTGFDEPLSSAMETVEQFFNRAVLEKCRFECNKKHKLCVREKSEINSQDELVEWIQKELISENCSLSIERIKETISECAVNKWAMQAHLIVRQIAGQVLESLILVDRLLYVKRNGVECAVEWALGGLSGRGLAVWARK